MWEGLRTDGNPAEEPHPEAEATEIGDLACLLLSLLGTAVSGCASVGVSPDADREDW